MANVRLRVTSILVLGLFVSACEASSAGDGSGSGADPASQNLNPADNATDNGSPALGGVAGRTRVLLSSGWKFLASDTLMGAEAPNFDDSHWASVTVPHTWDSVTRVTKHASSWYRLHVSIPADAASKQQYLYFEGAFQVADVYVNGQHLGQHRGGYTRFVFDATAAIVAGKDNVVAVKVSNADCADCLPDGNVRLFKGYGGLYRKAWLLTTNRYHVATTDYASSGLYLTPSHVTAASAHLSNKIKLTNDTNADQMFHVESVISDPHGLVALTLKSDVLVKARSTTLTEQKSVVAQPALWSPAAPNLYRVRVNLSVGAKLVDTLDDHIGFRSYQLTDTDFTLNGVSTRLRGVCKHQETEYHASAVSDDELIADWDNLQDLGVNYVRLAHYPHAQLEYDLADQRGIMVWAENGHTNSGAPTANGDHITKEMIYQNWNHPSIIFWSVGNEAGGVAASSEYAAVAHATDPSRPIVYASNGQQPANLDFTFHNTYAGWYGGEMYEFLTSGDHFISESGAGMAIGTHTADAFAMNRTPNHYEPEEYGELVDEVRFDDLFRKPSHVPAFSAWVFREFSDGKYKGLINTKGLLTFAGHKKNVFYHFQSLLRNTPVVHLVGPEYFLRTADSAQHGAVKAYSNAAELTLTVNGTAQPKKLNDEYRHPNGTPIKDVFYWPDALVLGKNVIVADDGKGHSDTMTVYYLGTGSTLPAEAHAPVANLKSSNGPAYYIGAPIHEQRPFYVDFDSTGDNTFDTLPAEVAGASWIATRRQSDPQKRTDLDFDVTTAADIFILFTRQGTVPAWITNASFTDSGATVQWRDNGLKLVAASLFRRSVSAGTHVSLASSAIDYVVLVK
jgi:beta-galactosidase